MNYIHHIKLLSILYIALLITSCAPASRPDYVPGPGIEYVTASWYGEKFHGRPTSCGERYDMYGLTAAHKTMKFGIKLRVTNPDNNKSVVVIVNDRGPFIPGRDLDLSYGAAKAIGHVEKGVGRVKIEYLGRDMRYVKRLPYLPNQATPEKTGPMTIQVGSFTENENALRLKEGLTVAYNNVYITTANLKGQTFYRVRVGTFKEYDKAYSVAEKLADEGYEAFIISRD